MFCTEKRQCEEDKREIDEQGSADGSRCENYRYFDVSPKENALPKIFEALPQDTLASVCEALVSIGRVVTALKGHVETKNEPLVKKFVSVCAPQGGVGSCPSNQLYKMVRARAS